MIKPTTSQTPNKIKTGSSIFLPRNLWALILEAISKIVAKKLKLDLPLLRHFVGGSPGPELGFGFR